MVSDVPSRMEMAMQSNTQSCHNEVLRQNDQFRCFGIGRGTIMLTSGVHERGAEFRDAAVQAVRTFDAFTRDNDSHCEHDFGGFTLHGERLFFKIDYYDLGLTAHSPDPADPAVTHRVLTIMLASEY